MKMNEKWVAAYAGIGCMVLFTALLIGHFIGAVSFVSLAILAVAASVAIATLPRLQEFTFKLGEMKLVLAKLEEKQAELAEMYGGIDHIRRAPLVLDVPKQEELGLLSGVMWTSSGMRYVVGCMKRERERLARIFIAEKTPDKLAEAILDGSLDDKVFKWNGPETSLHVLPKSVAKLEREAGEGTQIAQ